MNSTATINLKVTSNHKFTSNPKATIHHKVTTNHKATTNHKVTNNLRATVKPKVIPILKLMRLSIPMNSHTASIKPMKLPHTNLTNMRLYNHMVLLINLKYTIKATKLGIHLKAMKLSKHMYIPRNLSQSNQLYQMREL